MFAKVFEPIQEVATILKGCSKLERLDLSENAVTKVTNYRKQIIPLANSSLSTHIINCEYQCLFIKGELDQKEILPNEREFLKNLANKNKKKRDIMNS
jgi:hypothetical protein